jgi:hypothetical protein
VLPNEVDAVGHRIVHGGEYFRYGLPPNPSSLRVSLRHSVEILFSISHPAVRVSWDEQPICDRGTVSHDVRSILTAVTAGNLRAELAVDLFCYRLARALLGLTAGLEEDRWADLHRRYRREQRHNPGESVAAFTNS